MCLSITKGRSGGIGGLCSFRFSSLNRTASLTAHNTCRRCTGVSIPKIAAKKSATIRPSVVTRSGGSIVSSNLVSVLKDELKFARESYRKDEKLLSDPPSDFELEDEPGKNLFYLVKEYKNEQVIIEVSLESEVLKDQDSDEEERAAADAEEYVDPVSFEVQIVKNEKTLLTFQCLSNGDFLTIQGLALENDDESRDNYTGPDFEDVDDTLQQAFVDFLGERGVTEQLGEYIRLLVLDKAAVEYQSWLSRLTGFVLS